MKVTLYKGAAAINKAIASIKNRGAKLDGDIQVAGLSVLAHVDEHHDTTVADALVNAMPKSGRKLALVEFLLANGKVRLLDSKIKDEAVRVKAGAVFAYAKDKQTKLDLAEEKPWYEYKKEASIATAFDAQAQIKALLTRLTNAKESGLTIEHKAEALAEARALVAALEA